MGYSYGRSSSGRYLLACDACGNVGGVRKRTCPHVVYDEHGHGLPYCPPPALCAACWTKHGRNAIHDPCRARAIESQRRYDERRARLEAGELAVRAAWGDWAEGVPAGMVRVLFEGLEGRRAHYLIPKPDYSPGEREYLSDYTAAQLEQLEEA